MILSSDRLRIHVDRLQLRSLTSDQPEIDVTRADIRSCRSTLDPVLNTLYLKSWQHDGSRCSLALCLEGGMARVGGLMSKLWKKQCLPANGNRQSSNHVIILQP